MLDFIIRPNKYNWNYYSAEYEQNTYKCLSSFPIANFQTKNNQKTKTHIFKTKTLKNESWDQDSSLNHSCECTWSNSVSVPIHWWRAANSSLSWSSFTSGLPDAIAPSLINQAINLSIKWLLNNNLCNQLNLLAHGWILTFKLAQTTCTYAIDGHNITNI